MAAKRYRMPTMEERELSRRVADLESRLAAMVAGTGADREVALREARIAELEEALGAASAEFAGKVAALSVKLDDERGRRKSCEGEIARLESELRRAREQARIAEMRAANAERRAGEINEDRRRLKADLKASRDEASRLQMMVEHLSERLSRNPENSSAPPSSSPNRKRIPNSRVRTGRKPGGQPGHRGHVRKARAADETVELGGGCCCPRCGSAPFPTGRTRTRSVTDVRVSAHTVEYVSRERACPRCGEVSWDEFPSCAPNESNYGPRLKALLAYLVNACNVSIDNARGIVSELTDGEVSVSKGAVASFCAEFSRRARGEIAGLCDEVSSSRVIGSDATFVRSSGHQSYVYVFHGGNAAVFTASDVKGHSALRSSPLSLAPRSTVVHDHDTAYYSYCAGHGECNVHALRYLRGVVENEGAGGRWADAMSGLLCKANEVAKAARDEGAGAVDPSVSDKVEKAYLAILDGALSAYDATGAAAKGRYAPDGYRLARRMRKYADNHLLFLRDLSVPFDNNKSERLLRGAKKKVKQSGGFRSTANGQQPYCDFLSIVESAKLRGESPFEAVVRIFDGEGGSPGGSAAKRSISIA